MAEAERSLATILFTDIVASTEKAAELGDRAWRALLRKHHALVRRELRRHGGREVATAGDGFLATFDRPERAIRCACAVREGVRALGLEIRGGIHVGEVAWEGSTVGGIAVHIGARVAARAAPGELLVSSTVRDLQAGSDFGFEDRGHHTLKGVPGEWRLFAVSSCPPLLTAAADRSLLSAAKGRGVLAGTLTFLLLFLLAGLYVGLRDGGDTPERRRAVPPWQDPPEASSPSAGQPSGMTPPAVADAARPAPADAAPPAPADAARRAPAPPEPASGTLPPAPDAPAPPTGTADRSAAAPERPTEREAASPDPAAIMPAREELAATAYEAATTAADATRRAALQAGASQSSSELYQRAEASRAAARKAAERGRYAEAEEAMKLARRNYQLATVEAWRSAIAGARETVTSLRRLSDPEAPAYAAGETWERRAAEAEQAGRLGEAVSHLASAAQAYRQARPAPRPELVPPVAPADPPPPPAPPPAEERVAARPTVEATEEPAPEAAVQDVLEALRDALQEEDLAALRRTWSSLSARDASSFESWFDLIRDLEVRYEVRSIARSQDGIMVTLQTTYEYFNESTDENGSETFRQVLELARRDGRWVIVENRQ